MTEVRTGELSRVYSAENYWISRHACLNYDENEIIGAGPMDDMVEMVCREEHKDMAHNVTLFDEAVLWCKENCEGLIYANLLSGKFDFEIEADAFAFKMRW